MTNEETVETNLDSNIDPQEAAPDETAEEPLATSFDQLLFSQSLLKRVTELGFITPTPVQSRTIPIAREGKNLLVQAKTGSGKTLAFGLPSLEYLEQLEANGPVDHTAVLVLSPTRELALQIREVISTISPWGAPPCLIGGQDISKQIEMLKNDPRIVIGTPGRVLDCLRQRALWLGKCAFVVLDEADEMLSMGFLEDVRAILSRLPDKRQGLFVSATITGRVEMLANSFLSKPERIVVDRPKEDLPPIEHFYCEIGGDLMAKPLALCDLLETLRPRSAIIFCNTKSDTQLVEVLLRRRGFDARRINSDLTQKQRDRVMAKIRSGDLQFLVATDIAARGLDMEQIDLVVNYAVHDDPESYVHRTGRTGRAGRSGKAVSLVSPKDFGAFHYLTKVVNADFKKIDLPTDSEVADARLAHLYEILREAKLEVKTRDALVAAKLLKDLGDITDPSDDFKLIIGKLCRHTVEHFISHEAKALEEELAPSGQASEDEEDSERGERRGRERQREEREPRRREGRGDERQRQEGRGEERSGGRERGERNREQHDERQDSQPRQGRRQDDRQGSDGRQQENRGRDRGHRESSRNQHSEDAGNEVRLYIGQGFTHGMTSDVFSALATDYANVRPGELKKLSLRDYYGYVDVDQDQARALIDNLNGVEHNGEPLPVEFATLVGENRSRPPRDRNRDDRRGGRGNDRRQQRRR